MNLNYGTLTCMGSGEIGDSMAKVHRSLLTRLGDSPRPVFLDTPAGFELNVDEISAKAVDYFKQRLNVDLAVASFKSRDRDARQIENALHALRHANYIFAGPGSPSYAVNTWRGSSIWDTVVERWENGAHLVLASAAAIGISYAVLPVYEIYKAGQDAHWIKGLDLLGRLGLKLAVVPHWNNTEGQTYDTRFCFMGAPRLKILEQQLEPGVGILGIDEHTSITLDPGSRTCSVAGAGQVAWRTGGRELTWAPGMTISFDELRSDRVERPQNGGALPISAAPRTSSEQLVTAEYFEQLARAMRSSGDPTTQREVVDHAHEAVHELAQGASGSDHPLFDERPEELVDLLIQTRARLRAAKQFALADEIRDGLVQLGVVLQDTATGTVWSVMDDHPA